MVVYNITIKISADVEKDWVQWQKDEHIPDIMATGKFHAYSFYKLLEQAEEEESTYIIQYSSNSFEKYQEYLNESAPLLRKKAIQKWGNRFIAFRTVMHSVD